MRKILLGGLLVACTAGARTAPQPGICPDFQVDTTSWKEGRSYEVGARLLLPPGFQQELVGGQTIGEGAPPSAHFWNYPSTITLYRTTPDSATRQSGLRAPNATSCQLPTASGMASAYVQERIVSRGTSTSSQFTIAAQLPRGEGQTVVLFVGRSRDSATFKQQLAAARTLALRGPTR